VKLEKGEPEFDRLPTSCTGLHYMTDALYYCFIWIYELYYCFMCIILLFYNTEQQHKLQEWKVRWWSYMGYELKQYDFLRFCGGSRPAFAAI